ncbi:MAG: bifunctional glycosyltransferase family 2/GtrA family protein [Clostridia bacterium]|nr:bifunctional glycosyltransferase family 2/GtrA family protein [Clostridia bacterium]
MNEIINSEVEVPIVIPSYEPDERLIELLDTLADKNRRIILVNDGSSPEYKDLFKRAFSMIEPFGGVFLEHEVNRGKGKALKTAFDYVIKNIPNAIGVVTADSDGQHTKDCINSVTEEFIKYPDCLILGVRSFGGEDVPWKSRFGNECTIKVMKFVSGLSISDTQTGLRAIPLEFMKELVDFGGDRFEFETEMLLATVDKYEIREVEIPTIYDSRENHQTHFNPVKDSIKIYKILGKQFFKYILASGSSFILDILLFYIFCKVFSSFKEYISIATALARICSATFNYVINYSKVFKGNETKLNSALKYLCLAVIQMLLSALFVTCVVKLTNSNEVIVKIIVDTILFFISFKIQQRFVFVKKRKSKM